MVQVQRSSTAKRVMVVPVVLLVAEDAVAAVAPLLQLQLTSTAVPVQ